jgi:polar amino acid transport system substrate-binding protein
MRVMFLRPRAGARTGRVLGLAAAGAVLAVAAAGCGSSDEPVTAQALDPQVVKDGSLTVCTSVPYPPFEFMQKGEPAGFDIDLAGAVASELKLKPVIVNADFDDIQSGKLLNEGKCDVAVAGLTITGERARVLDFSSPYFDATQALVVPKASGVTSLDDLAGGRIGVQKGTTGELYVTDHAPSDAQVVPYADADDVDAAIKLGDVDAGVYDSTVVGDVVSRNPTFQVVAEFDTGEQYGMAVKKNGSVDLLRFINDELTTMKADGGYDELYNKWFLAAVMYATL